MAHLFMKEIVSKCTHGIDFHTGAIHKTNYPQIRADLDVLATAKFARSFGAPIIIDSKVRDGSLREAARKKGVMTLLFEGGQALRFEDDVINQGKQGCLRALRSIGLIPRVKVKTNKSKSVVALGSYWVRSPMGGTCRFYVDEGAYITAGQNIGEISDTFGEVLMPVIASDAGYIIGVNKLPLVTIGEALVHIATVKPSKASPNNLKDEIFYE